MDTIGPPFRGPGSGFTIRIRADLGGVACDEALLEAGPMRLSLRLAGRTPGLEEYDAFRGNYLNFALPHGPCPVIEATLPGRGGRIGVPLGALPRAGGVHAVTLQFDPPRWTIRVDGVQDEDYPADVVDWDGRELHAAALSPRVEAVEASVPALPDALPRPPDSRRLARSVQYWTPDDPDAWVGDVALCAWRGRLHVFYLFDRRHHGSGGGAGRHFFAHISSADLVAWDEHPPAVPIERWWETIGTGTPFVHEGRLHIAYGLHTDRIAKDPSLPIGATYAVSDDGVHFRKSGRIVHPTQNPTVYNRADGLLGLAAGYGGQGGLWTAASPEGAWTLADGTLPTGGDCPCPFEWNGHHYVFQGFGGFAHSATGKPGTWEDWAAAGLAPYDGLSVPMVAPFGEGRRILAGWLGFLEPAWWGGWLVFRELVQFPDGTLGTKWVPEIEPPSPPETFAADPGRSLRVAFPREDGGPALVFALDPAARTASFADDVPDAAFAPSLHAAGNVRIRNLPAPGQGVAVRIVRHWDPKAGATVFDAEIGGVRTLACRRRGRFGSPSRG